MSVEWVGVIFSLLSALSFSFSAVFYKKGEVGLNSIESNALRCVFPFVFLIAMTVYLDEFTFFDLNIHVFTYIFIATIVALVIGDTLYIESIRKVGVSTAVSVSYTYPIFTCVIAYFFLGERVGIFVFMGAVLAVLGIILLNRRKNETSILTIRKEIWLALSAAILWAIGISIFRYILFDYDLLHLTFWRTVILTLTLAPVILNGLRKTRLRSILYLNVGGFLGIALGSLLLYSSLAIIGAARTVTFSATNPLFSMLLGRTLLKDKLTRTQILGIMSITAGLLTSTLF